MARGIWASGVLPVVAAAVLSGCPGGGGSDEQQPGYAKLDLALRRAVPVRTIRASAPRSAAPSPVDGLVMLDSDRGVVISRGVANLTGRWVIQRTTDGGAHWRTVLSSRRIELRWIGRDGRDIVAAGVTQTTPGCESEPGCNLPLLLRSRDAGAHWTRTRPRVSARLWRNAERFVFSGRGDALAISGDDPRAGFGVLRSSDHGRSWRAVRLPRGGRASGVALTSGGRVAYVSAFHSVRRSRGCTSGVSRSDDHGRHWRLLPGSCGLVAPLVGVGFADGRHGFAVGGGSGFGGRRYVLSTADGGRAWRRRAPFPSAAERFVFADGRHGWALSDVADDRLQFTVDGGRHWRDSGQYASELSVTGPFGAFIASDRRMLRTRDGGRTWMDFGSLREVGPASVTGSGWVVASTAAGQFLSRDGARRWTKLVPPRSAAYAPLVVVPGLIAWPDGTECRGLIISRDGGRTFERVAGPIGGRGCAYAIAFTDAHRGFAITNRGDGTQRPRRYETRDGGRSWRRSGLRGLGGYVPESLAITRSGSFAVNAGRLRVSGDGGRSWTVAQGMPPGYGCDQVAALDRDVWLRCTGALRGARAALFHSADGGRSWRAFVPRNLLLLPSRIAAFAPGRALGTNEFDDLDDPGASLIALQDGGADWRQVWPALPIGPNARG